MPELSEDSIRRELAPNERLLWLGQPRQGFFLRGPDIFLIPFSIMWGGFAIFWEVMAVRGGAPFFFALWGVPFVLVGLYMIFGRFWVDARQRANTMYAVTSDRVIILSGIFNQGVKSLSVDTITDLTLTERRNGSGTIMFGPAPFGSWMYAGGAGWPGMTQQLPPYFELPFEARHVYEIIREAQRAAKRST